METQEKPNLTGFSKTHLKADTTYILEPEFIQALSPS